VSDTKSAVYAGLQVLDLTNGIAGPMVTMLLADNGATVTRLVRPGSDPDALSGTGARVWNRSKRTIELDISTAAGRAELDRLAADADIVVDSLSIDAAQRADLDRLTSDNPRLIHLSITAYGDHPDHRHRPGIDALVMARTGMLYDQKGRRGTVMEYINGRPGPHPDFDAPDGMQRGTARPGPIMPRTTRNCVSRVDCCPTMPKRPAISCQLGSWVSSPLPVIKRIRRLSSRRLIIFACSIPSRVSRLHSSTSKTSN